MGYSFGVSGSHVNDKLVDLSVFLKGLDKNEYVLELYNPNRQSEAFAANKEVSEMLKVKGPAALPYRKSNHG